MIPYFFSPKRQTLREFIKMLIDAFLDIVIIGRAYEDLPKNPKPKAPIRGRQAVAPMNRESSAR
jgi:hypothetical protein